MLAAVDKGVRFLASTQRVDGGFISHTSSSKAPFVPIETRDTTIAATVVLSALHAIPETRALRERAAAWLLQQKSAAWTWNHWGRRMSPSSMYAHPDNLDDTFQALIGLMQHDAHLVDAAALGAAVRLLVTAEQQLGGPYRTWPDPPAALAAWQNVDLAVNANIAYFLGLVGSTLPGLSAYNAAALRQKAWQSSLYASDYAVLYYDARAYAGPTSRAVVDELHARRQSGYWGTPLQTALAVTTLRALDADEDVMTAKRYLIKQQQADGSWAAEAFRIDPFADNGPVYVGSAAVTTAFVLEALASTQPDGASLRQSHPSRSDVRALRLASKIKAVAHEDAEALPPVLRQTTGRLLRYMQHLENTLEIMLLPYFFAESLKRPASVDDTFFMELGVASLYGWLAYTVFDDFLDDEGKPAQLPSATLALRRSLAHFRNALPTDALFQVRTQQTFDIIDGANAWEVKSCRFRVSDDEIQLTRLPDYTNPKHLYERSIGHALTPLAVLVAIGQPLDGKPARAVDSALRHYLAARQLMDDLHDWEHDMRAGHISYVVAAILQDLQLGSGRQPFVALIPRMQQTFWRRTLPRCCGVVMTHIKAARNALKRSRLVADDVGIASLLAGLEATIARTLQEQDSAEGFLAAYRTDHHKASL